VTLAVLIEEVNPKIVQGAPRHASIAITTDLYLASIPSLQKVAANSMGETLARLVRPKTKKAA
jgi:hypothetical protein